MDGSIELVEDRLWQSAVYLGDTVYLDVHVLCLRIICYFPQDPLLRVVWE